MARLKVAVLISGRGSNLQALLDACATPDFPAEIIQVIANVPDCYGLTRAEQAGVATRVINHKDFASREDFDAALDKALREIGAEFVCLAGFMRLLTADFTRAWQGRMINIHPSLLPAFKGLNTHERAIETGVRFHGCSVHFVTPDLDDGPIVAQACVPVKPEDDAKALAARVLAAEHKLYPLALELIASGNARLRGSRVDLSAEAPDFEILSPKA